MFRLHKYKNTLKILNRKRKEAPGVQELGKEEDEWTIPHYCA
jgi:hypothetical protein